MTPTSVIFNQGLLHEGLQVLPGRAEQQQGAPRVDGSLFPGGIKFDFVSGFQNAESRNLGPTFTTSF